MSGAIDITIIIPSAPYRNAEEILANLKKVAPKNKHIEVLIIKGTWPPLQRNVGIKQAKGKYIFFFDDDIVVPPGSIQQALQTFEINPHIAVVGGPNLTPPGNTFLQHCFGEAHASAFTGLHTSVRYKKVNDLKNVNENHLITCNLAFKADILKANPFGTEIYANEENELLGRLVRKGHKLAYNKDFFVYHHRRPTIGKYLKQIVAWGAGRTMHTLKRPAHLDLTFFVPLAFLFYLLSLTIFSPLWYQAPLFVYFILAILFAIRISISNKNPLYLLVMPWIFLATHLSYAIGLLLGFFQNFQHRELPDPKSFDVHHHVL
ncbi:glycosyltransferase [Candidatus Peregrinibacteria bacterium]|nr:glycosyltransferase [Candidatus Peregrinibacteria bacterium]